MTPRARQSPPCLCSATAEVHTGKGSSDRSANRGRARLCARAGESPENAGRDRITKNGNAQNIMARQNRQTYRTSGAFVPYGSAAYINNRVDLPAAEYGNRGSAEIQGGSGFGVTDTRPVPGAYLPSQPSPAMRARFGGGGGGSSSVETPTARNTRGNRAVAWNTPAPRPSVSITPQMSAPNLFTTQPGGTYESSGYQEPGGGRFWPDTRVTQPPSFGSRLFRSALRGGAGLAGTALGTVAGAPMAGAALGRAAGRFIPNARDRVTQQTAGPVPAMQGQFGFDSRLWQSQPTANNSSIGAPIPGRGRDWIYGGNDAPAGSIVGSQGGKPVIAGRGGKPIYPSEYTPPPSLNTGVPNVYGRGIGLGGVTSSGNWNTGVRHSGLNSPVREYAGPVNHAVTPDYRGADPHQFDAEGNVIFNPGGYNAMDAMTRAAFAQDPQRAMNMPVIRRDYYERNARLGYPMARRVPTRGGGGFDDLGNFGPAPVSDATSRFLENLNARRRRHGGGG